MTVMSLEHRIVFLSIRVARQFRYFTPDSSKLFLYPKFSDLIYALTFLISFSHENFSTSFGAFSSEFTPKSHP
jgi:hypothetical protein